MSLCRLKELNVVNRSIDRLETDLAEAEEELEDVGRRWLERVTKQEEAARADVGLASLTTRFKEISARLDDLDDL